MKAVQLLIILAGLFGGGLQNISQTNQYVQEAARAYEQQDYTYAIAAYEYLLNKLEVEDDQIRLNLAHSYYRANNLDRAKKQYQLLTNHPSVHMRALATLQLGNIALLQKQYKKALALYKNALIAEPGNESARYNYELLKKYLDRHPELNQDKGEDSDMQEDQLEPDFLPIPPEEQEAPTAKKKPDSEGSEQEEVDTKEQDENGSQQDKSGPGNTKDTQQNKDKPGDREREEASGTENGNTLGQNPESSPESGQRQFNSTAENISEQDQRAQTQRARLQQMNLTPEKAQMLLDAMRNAELQYIQQLPKKATRKPDRSKPDW